MKEMEQIQQSIKKEKSPFKFLSIKIKDFLSLSLK